MVVFKIRGRAVNKHSIAPHQSAGYGLRFIFLTVQFVGKSSMIGRNRIFTSRLRQGTAITR